MGIKELEEHLRKKGDEEIRGIRRERDESLKALESESSEAIQSAVGQISKDGTKEAESVKKRILAKAKIEAKDREEREKIGIAEEVLEKAREKILKASDAKKKEILKRLAGEATAEVRDPVVYVDKKYVSLLSGAKAKDIGDFGVIVEGKESGVMITNTLSNKIERTRDEMMPKIVKVLFAEGGKK